MGGAVGCHPGTLGWMVDGASDLQMDAQGFQLLGQGWVLRADFDELFDIDVPVFVQIHLVMDRPQLQLSRGLGRAAGWGLNALTVSP